MTGEHSPANRGGDRSGMPFAGDLPKLTAMDADTYDVLSLIADDPRHNDDYVRFLAACRLCADPSGRVDPNHVRARLSNRWGLTIEPRRYAAFWAKACGPLGPMLKLPEWVADDQPGNRNKMLPLRQWTGEHHVGEAK